VREQEQKGKKKEGERMGEWGEELKLGEFASLGLGDIYAVIQIEVNSLQESLLFKVH